MVFLNTRITLVNFYVSVKLLMIVINYFNLSAFFNKNLWIVQISYLCTSGLHDCYRRCFVGPSGFVIGLQTAPRVKIIDFTPSVHNILHILNMFTRFKQ
jgi:hypothetical protein